MTKSSDWATFITMMVVILVLLLVLARILPSIHRSVTIYGTALSAQCTQAWLDNSRVVIKVYNGTNAGQQGVYSVTFEGCLVFATPANAEQLWKLTVHTDNGWIVNYQAVTA